MLPNPQRSFTMVSTRGKGQYKSPPAANKSKKRTSEGTTRKVKDKVSSTVASPGKLASVDSLFSDLSSDEFDNEEEEDIKADWEDSDGSVVSSSSQRHRLPENLVRQLLIDIQEAGGIHCFHLKSIQALSELLNKRQKLYGSRGEPIRERIRKKVHRWRKAYERSEGEWYAVLAKHKITVKPSKNHFAQPAQVEADIEDEGASTSIPQKPAAKPKPQPAQRQSVTIVSTSVQSQSLSSAIQKLPDKMSRKDYPSNTGKLLLLASHDNASVHFTD